MTTSSCTWEKSIALNSCNWNQPADWVCPWIQELDCNNLFCRELISWEWGRPNYQPQWKVWICYRCLWAQLEEKAQHTISLISSWNVLNMPSIASCAIGFSSSSNRVEALFQSHLTLKESGPPIWLRAMVWKTLELMSHHRLTNGI